MNTDTDAELLPCPFCGSDKVSLCQWMDTENPHATWVECTNCGIQQDTFHHEDADHVTGIATMMWNTRMPNVTQLAAENDRLKKEVEAAMRLFDALDQGSLIVTKSGHALLGMDKKWYTSKAGKHATALEAFAALEGDSK